MKIVFVCRPKLALCVDKIIQIEFSQPMQKSFCLLKDGLSTLFVNLLPGTQTPPNFWTFWSFFPLILPLPTQPYVICNQEVRVAIMITEEKNLFNLTFEWKVPHLVRCMLK